LSLNRNEKAAVVTDVAAQVARSQTLALAEYRGLTVEHLNALRKQARAQGVYLRKVAVSSTMGIGVRVDIASLTA
jgi:large subunit ribosomal protein L10